MCRTNPDLANLMGDTDVDFENLYFFEFLGYQISGFPDCKTPDPSGGHSNHSSIAPKLQKLIWVAYFPWWSTRVPLIRCGTLQPGNLQSPTRVKQIFAYLYHNCFALANF